MYVLLSISSLNLWDNDISEFVYSSMKSINSNYNKQNKYNIPRHDVGVIGSFQLVYGQFLQTCSFAILKEVPSFLENYYRIIRVSCYASVSESESILISVKECLAFFQSSDEFETLKKHLQNIVHRVLISGTGESKFVHLIRFPLGSS